MLIRLGKKKKFINKIKAEIDFSFLFKEILII
jgi:hypothetical protein